NWALLFTGLRELRVDGQITKRSSPSAIAQNRSIFTTRKMTNSKHNDFLWNFDSSKNRTGDVSGVDVARVRYEAAFYTFFCGRRFFLHALPNKIGEFAGIGGIKLSCNCGEAKHKALRKIKSVSKLCLLL